MESAIALKSEIQITGSGLCHAEIFVSKVSVDKKKDIKGLLRIHWLKRNRTFTLEKPKVTVSSSQVLV